ncbi:MAG: PEP-CTERM sorting domain-containing protein [Planctomycetota bacterium]
MTVKQLLATGICASMAVGSASAIELAVNGDFETGDFTGWTQFDSNGIEGPNGEQSVTSVNPSSGTWAGAIDNQNDFSNSLIKQANLAPGLLTAGQTVNIQFDARGSYAVPGGVAFAEFFTELSGGGTSSAEILGGAPLAINADPDVWTTFNFSTVVGPDSSGGITLQLGATTGPGIPTQMFYDNVSITVDSLIPEPATASLLALGGLVAARRRRA